MMADDWGENDQKKYQAHWRLSSSLPVALFVDFGVYLRTRMFCGTSSKMLPLPYGLGERATLQAALRSPESSDDEPAFNGVALATDPAAQSCVTGPTCVSGAATPCGSNWI